MTAKTFLDKLEAMAATNGKKDKLAIIQTFDELDKVLAKWALDPTISYYIANLKPTPTMGVYELDEEDLVLLDMLSKRSITGDAALAKVNLHLGYLTVSDSEVLRRIILKDLRCGVGATLVNTAFPGLIPDFPYCRCSLPKASNIEKWDWTGGVYCQLKADGSFARVAHNSDGSVLITTRQGNTYPDTPALSRLKEAAQWVLAAGTETHGEITVWVDHVLQPRTIGNGMLNSLMQGGELPEGARLKFDCWDQIPLAVAKPKGKYEVPYQERFLQLKNQVEGGGCVDSVELIEGDMVYSYSQAMEMYRGFLARGLEGAILKHPEMAWIDGTSKNAVKLKLEVDLDLKIVGFNPGTPGTRTEATFGSLKVQSLDGLLEADVAGFKRETEQYLHENRESVLGKILCVRANALAYPSESNEKHSLFHPRFVELRSDKDEADSLDQVKAQFEAAIT